MARLTSLPLLLALGLAPAVHAELPPPVSGDLKAPAERAPSSSAQKPAASLPPSVSPAAKDSLPPPVSEKLKPRAAGNEAASSNAPASELPKPLDLEVKKKERYTLMDAAISPVQVFIGVRKVTGIDQKGNERVLFEDMMGINLPLEQLPAIEAQMNPRLIPQGHYTNLTMQFTGNYMIKKLHGHTMTLPLEDIGAPEEIPLQGEVVVAYGKVESRGLGFDPELFNQLLPRHISNMVAPAIEAGY